MVDTTPKISFIPKAPLAREERALRPRPRSALVIVASIVFIASIGAYLGLFFYHRALANDVNSVTSEIEQLQKDFDRPEINEARAFRARADLARALLSQHTTMRPLFAFLERYTVEKIFYTDFSFTRDGAEGPSLELKGEAPDYASLAYQMDTFRGRDELKDFSVHNLTLTRTGTVMFSLSLVFTPGFLSYTEYVTHAASLSGEQTTLSLDVSTSTPTSFVVTTTPEGDGGGVRKDEVACELPLIRVVREDGTVVCADNGTSQRTTAETLKSFWSWLKFW